MKAHDLEAVRRGDPRACGNDQVDAVAKAAVQAGFVAPTHAPEDDFADAVRVRGRDGKWIVDINAAIASSWWIARREEGSQRREWIAALYPSGLELDWQTSNYIFQLPTVVNGVFVNVVSAPVIKWVARARAGALATSARKAKSGLGSTPVCPCCGHLTDDDSHVVLGVPVPVLLIVVKWLLVCGCKPQARVERT